MLPEADGEFSEIADAGEVARSLYHNPNGTRFAGQGSKERHPTVRVMPSSVIRNFQYRADQQALDVTFVSGRRYRYLQVPGAVYEGMRASFSKGEYFNRYIRDYYPFERIGGAL